MATVTAPADDRVVSAAEFARLRGVHRSRVTRYIKEGKIDGAALVKGERGTKIRVGLALAQLRERLDIGQQIGNGIDARFDTDADQVVLPSSGSEAEAEFPQVLRPDDTIEGQIKRERLRKVQIENRKAAEDDAARRGRFIESDTARAQMSAIAAAVLQSFEGGLPDMARAVAAKFELPQRDVLHELHSEFRKIRTAAAKRAEKKLAEMPKIRETVLEAEDEVPT